MTTSREKMKTMSQKFGKQSQRDQKNTPVSTTTTKEKTLLLTQNEVARNTVNDLIMKCIEGWKCKECGKTCSTRSQIGLHVEIHVQGLSFPCIFCSESFVSRNSLARHKFINHKK